VISWQLQQLTAQTFMRTQDLAADNRCAFAL
jgi:hypothetical protein